MMRFLLKLLALPLLLPLLAGCGFTPLHATAPGQAAFSDIALSIGEGRNENDRAAGFMLRQNLADRIGTTGPARYTLNIEPRVRRIGFGLTGQDRATRFDSTVQARWSLVETATGDRIDRGAVARTATFSADRDPYSQLSSSESGVDRAAREVADDLLKVVALAIAEQSTAP